MSSHTAMELRRRLATATERAQQGEVARATLPGLTRAVESHRAELQVLSGLLHLALPILEREDGQLAEAVRTALKVNHA